MATRKNEEESLRSVALQNTQSIFLARQRAEEELIRTKEALEVKTQELTHSLAMMRATLEATSNGILVTDGHGKVMDFNEQFVTMWQLPLEALDTREHLPLLTVISQYCKEPRQFLARIDDINASSPSETYDLVECTDGRVFERFSRIQFVEERNVGRVWSFRDITERRQAEEASLRLAAIIESSDDAIISKSLDGIVTSWNAGAERIFGYRAEEMSGQSILRLLPEDRQDEEQMILERLRRGERVDHFETVRRTKDGRLLDVSVTISPLRDGRGRIIGASKIARDITERKRAEEALRESERRFRTLLEHSADSFSIIDADNNILYLSPSVATVEGYAAEELVGRNGIENTHPDDLPLVQEIVRQLLDHPGTPIPVLWRRRHKNGHWLWLEGIATNLLHDPAVQGIVTNYTARGMK